jgi:hypothetical protein
MEQDIKIESYLVGTWKRSLEHKKFSGNFETFQTTNTIVGRRIDGVHRINS